MGWIIKKFDELTREELYNIMVERVNVFVVEQQCPYPELDHKDNKAYHLFYKKNDEIIAYARMFRRGDYYEEASIGRVIVKQDYRKEGLGKDLLMSAIDFLHSDMEETAIKIQAQDYLRKFYGYFGFEPISDVYLEDNIPHVDMLLKWE